MLFFPRESFPTDRVRLNTLFGRELLARGHEIDLVMQAGATDVVTGRRDWFGRSIWVGPTVSRPGPLGAAARVTLSLWHDLRCLLRARPEKYEAVLVSDKYLLAAVGCAIARMRGMAFLFWMTYPYHQAQLTLAREKLTGSRTLAWLRGQSTEALLFRWILPRSHHIFVQSSRMAQDFAARGVPPGKMTPIVTGIDLSEITVKPRAFQGPRAKCATIGYLGTLVRQRRLDVLVDMLHELAARGVDAKLLLIGDGATPGDRRLIEERAMRLGLGARLEITGFLPRRAALDLIQTADVCISPFRPSPALEVASPTKLIEYLALGLPVVANSHPDQTEVLRQSRAGVCVPWGGRYFARGVHWLLLRSPAELEAMASRGRQWVASHRSYSSISATFEASCLETVAALNPGNEAT